jgi:hypothetical protein
LELLWVDVAVLSFFVQLHELLWSHQYFTSTITVTKVCKNHFGIPWEDLDAEAIEASDPILEWDAFSSFEVEVAECVGDNLESLLNVDIYQFEHLLQMWVVSVDTAANQWWCLAHGCDFGGHVDLSWLREHLTHFLAKIFVYFNNDRYILHDQVQEPKLLRLNVDLEWLFKLKVWIRRLSVIVIRWNWIGKILSIDWFWISLSYKFYQHVHKFLVWELSFWILLELFNHHPSWIGLDEFFNSIFQRNEFPDVILCVQGGDTNSFE